MEKFYEFLEKKINLPEFERWIYNSNELENRISEENYQFLLEFNYKRPFAEIEIKDFIVTKIIGRKEFVSWKLDVLLKSNEIEIPEKDLFLFAKQKPDFLKGKQFKFQSYQADGEVEIFWTEKVSQFVRHTSEIDKNNEKYLYLGTYENSYIHLIVNRENEIWIAYDVIDEEKFLAKSLREAIIEIFMEKL